MTWLSCGRPSVSVPVLSIATVRTRARSSSAWPPLMSTPSRAARPTAETTATGMEMTSEHGQATMSSASARYSHVSQIAAERDRNDDDRERGGEHERRVDAREAVDEALGRRARALRLLDQRGDARERGVLRGLGRAHRQRALRVERARRRPCCLAACRPGPTRR